MLNLYFIQTILGTKCYWLCVRVNPYDHISNLQQEVNFKKIIGDDGRRGLCSFCERSWDGSIRGQWRGQFEKSKHPQRKQPPKPSVNWQYSFHRILKTLSLNPYERHYNWPYEEEVGKGGKNHNWLWGFCFVENLKSCVA